MKNEKPQAEKFKEAARELECDEDEALGRAVEEGGEAEAGQGRVTPSP